MLISALVTLGVALAENAADEDWVNNGTLGLETIVQGYVFTSDQSVSGVGFANSNSNLAVVNPDGSRSLNLKSLGSGSGYYSHNSSTLVQDNVAFTRNGEFAGSNRKITAKDQTSAVYAATDFQIPGSFRAKSIRSLLKDQTCTKNYAGIISMNALFDNAKALNKETTTTLYSNVANYNPFEESASSDIGSSMEINSIFDGTAHLGATINDVRGESQMMKAKNNDAVLVDEDYRGSFDITKKMAVNIKQTTNYGDFDKDDNDYPWLPCSCITGWDGMTIHDQRYHSAQGFFDCTTCSPQVPCKN